MGVKIMGKLYLQSIVDDISFEKLPEKWQSFDLASFSKDKILYDFQQQALKNVLKGLWLFYKEKNGNKQAFYNHYKNNGLTEEFNYDLKNRQDNKAVKYLLEYDQDYPVVDDKISFANFINRMSFWMATGSGKTLIIVKLIELLGTLINQKEIPQGDILFLAHRDDLLEQFQNHVEEFNSFSFDTKINLRSLKEYDAVRRQTTIPLARNEITVFCYRSDLISDEHKDKIIDFRNYDNGGHWYILLDEAHKGDKEESKRQILYSILSRNGFLFNFSATFTDPTDFITCVFNFNLEKFVKEGYGKHIYISSADVKAFGSEDDFSEIEKQKIVLKVLMLLAYINIYCQKIKQINSDLYHKPLLLTLVNSVNIEDSDLELFFQELIKVAKNEFRQELLNEAKKELVQDFSVHPDYEFEELKFYFDNDLISQLGYKDILKYIFNAESPGNIEVLKIPGNKQELIFKLKSTARPFGLIKIGDISNWLNEKLSGYEIIESFDNESYFKRINCDDSDINILMGARTFYEGWDSNRPNIVLFINIGTGNDAKKFVLQSIGRGVRIEPIKNKRRRIINLYNNQMINEKLFMKIKDNTLPIESLFVFGTKADNLKEIIRTLRQEKQEKDLGIEFDVNPVAGDKLLLIPVYSDSGKIFAEESDVQKYPISSYDFGLTSEFYEYLGDKIALVKYDCDIKVLKKVRESFTKKDKYYNFDESRNLFEPEFILERILKFFNITSKELDNFKKLENEIDHFKKISTIVNEQYDKIIEEIRKVKKYADKDNRISQLKQEFEKHKDIDKYTREVLEVEKQYVKEAEIAYERERVKIKYLANHYYLPIVISESEKIDYLTHIINIKSEVEFINELEKYLNTLDNIFNEFDWWMFSKIDQTTDKVYIPYYNPKENRIDNFKPDFIFWFKKGNKYMILFVDPKSTEYTDGYRKIDGYRRIFEDRGGNRIFYYNGLQLSVKLLLKARQMASVPENYKQYWFDNFEDFKNKVSDYLLQISNNLIL